MSCAERYPNETLELLMERASCRSFTDDEISPNVLRTVLDAGIHAATGGNLQPYSIVKVQQKERRQRLAEVCGGQEFVTRAPVNLVFCIDWRRSKRWAELEVAPFTATSSFRMFWTSFSDVIVCAQTVATAAESVGLGCVYVGTILPHVVEMRELLELPEAVFPAVILCLGYPDSRPEPAAKLGVDTIVHDETYQEESDAELTAAFDQKYGGRERQITDDRIKKIRQVCRETHGEEFAKACVDRIRENGFIGVAQTYFGLHYCADELVKDNEVFVKRLEECGLDWFNAYRPPMEKEK